ncbi:hypothetical protein [Larkinella terrae]|uniref:Anti-sigma factor n=1 Tax=Larkinella terrae TaxID=2025311 RepID=A0A7K0EF17_9BACT|nr:hypothetical protein [Larkinella terrae]MRS60056.1 hypothetical protein [Larkinella terrae]
MIQIFTNDDVIRYVYEETSAEENLLIEDALMAEPELMSFYLDTLEVKCLMNKIERTPSDRTIQNILNFSRNYATNPSV